MALIFLLYSKTQKLSADSRVDYLLANELVSWGRYCHMVWLLQSLREARSLLETASIEEALKYVESHQHPRLWFVLGFFAHGLHVIKDCLQVLNRWRRKLKERPMA